LNSRLKLHVENIFSCIYVSQEKSQI